VASYKGLVDWSRANIGSDPFANLPAMVQYARMSNTYRFTAAQVIVGQTVTALEAASVSMGVTQALALTLPTSGILKQIMAGIGTVSGVNFATLADMSALSAQANITLTQQTNASDPAQRMVQWACDSTGVKQWGLSIGLLPVMDGKYATRRANGSDTRSWYIALATKKNYPQMAWAKALAVGASLSGIAFRRYLAPDAPPEQVIQDGTRTWIAIDRPDATTSAQVARAPQVLGRKLTTVGATTLTAGSVVTGEGVTYTNTAPGYLLAEAVVDTTV